MGARPNGTKIALITGANRGIGFEVARQLGRRGMAVMIGARDLQHGADAAKTLRGEDLDARHVQLDVTDERTIRAAGQAGGRAFGRVDVLVNNAGVALDRGMPPSEVPIDVLRRTYATNVFGKALSRNLAALRSRMVSSRARLKSRMTASSTWGT
jgi:NAD(P)-dependent dehydrogenase (short-subunit alcohol dehydrogenase family)